MSASSRFHQEGCPRINLPDARNSFSLKPDSLLARSMVNNPLARFNLNLDGSNPEWTTESSDFTPPDMDVAERLIEGQPAGIIKDPETSQQFIGKTFGYDSNGKKIIYQSTAVSGLDDRLTAYRLLFASQFLDRPIDWFERPHLSEESALNMDMLDRFRKEGYSPVAAAQVRAMGEAGLPKSEPIDIVGSSLGGFTGAHLTEQLLKAGFNVENLVLIEPAGFTNDRHGAVTQFFAKLAFEGLLIDLYRQNPYDQGLARFTPPRPSLRDKIEAAKDYLEVLQRDREDLYLREISGQAATEKILLRILQANPNLRITVVNGGSSKICPSRNLRATKERFNRMGVGERLRRIVLPGENHLAGTNPGAYAKVVQLALSS